jgi:hypothetical protein
MSEMMFADVLRVCLNKGEFSGSKIRHRQFGFATDTNEIVVRRPGDGTYRFFYDDKKVDTLMAGKADKGHSHGNIRNDGSGGNRAQFLRGDGAWSNTLRRDINSQTFDSDPNSSHLTLQNFGHHEGRERGVRFAVSPVGTTIVTITPYQKDAITGAELPDSGVSIKGRLLVEQRAYCGSLLVGRGRQINSIDSVSFPVPSGSKNLSILLADLGINVNHSNLRVLSVHHTYPNGTSMVNISNFGWSNSTSSTSSTLTISELVLFLSDTSITVNFMTV